MLTFTPPTAPATPGPAHFGATPTPIEPVVPKEHSKVVADLLGLPPPGTLSERALKFINKKRAGFQRPLDPKASKWTDDDVVLEAKRLGWQP